MTDTGMTLRSPAFGDQEPIPARYAHEKDNVSPPLAWSALPEGAAELVLVVAAVNSSGVAG